MKLIKINQSIIKLQLNGIKKIYQYASNIFPSHLAAVSTEDFQCLVAAAYGYDNWKLLLRHRNPGCMEYSKKGIKVGVKSNPLFKSTLTELSSDKHTQQFLYDLIELVVVNADKYSHDFFAIIQLHEFKPFTRKLVQYSTSLFTPANLSLAMVFDISFMNFIFSHLKFLDEIYQPEQHSKYLFQKVNLVERSTNFTINIENSLKLINSGKLIQITVEPNKESTEDRSRFHIEFKKSAIPQLQIEINETIQRLLLVNNDQPNYQKQAFISKNRQLLNEILRNNDYEKLRNKFGWVAGHKNFVKQYTETVLMVLNRIAGIEHFYSAADLEFSSTGLLLVKNAYCGDAPLKMYRIAHKEVKHNKFIAHKLINAFDMNRLLYAVIDHYKDEIKANVGITIINYIESVRALMLQYGATLGRLNPQLSEDLIISRCEGMFTEKLKEFSKAS